MSNHHKINYVKFPAQDLEALSSQGSALVLYL